MLELIIIILIVGAAAYFTVRKLTRQVRRGSCAGCNCDCGVDINKYSDSAKTGFDRPGNINQYRCPGERG